MIYDVVYDGLIIMFLVIYTNAQRDNIIYLILLYFYCCNNSLIVFLIFIHQITEHSRRPELNLQFYFSVASAAVRRR